jgi:SsrA-binding protein
MLLVDNKRASFDYEIIGIVTAGAVLTGAEVKSLRLKAASLRGSFVQIVNGHAVLLNSLITPYKFADNRDYDPKRTRKLLLKKQELSELAARANQKGYALVPLRWELLGKHIKLVVGLAKGRAKFEKRQKLKLRDLQRSQQRHQMEF